MLREDAISQTQLSNWGRRISEPEPLGHRSPALYSIVENLFPLNTHSLCAVFSTDFRPVLVG